MPRTFSGDEFEVRVDSRKATIDLAQMKVNCAEDSMFEQIVQTGMKLLLFLSFIHLFMIFSSIFYSFNQTTSFFSTSWAKMVKPIFQKTKYYTYYNCYFEIKEYENITFIMALAVVFAKLIKK